MALTKISNPSSTDDAVDDEDADAADEDVEEGSVELEEAGGSRDEDDGDDFLSIDG